MDNALTDNDLMLRFSRTGDEAAFAALVRRWDGRVLAFLTKAAGDYHAALDLRQEVFIRLYRYGRTYDPAYAFTTWFFRIVSNVLNTWRAKQARLPRPTTGNGPTGGAQENPRRSAILHEIGGGIEKAVAELSPKERELVLLRLHLELSYREIGEILNEPETTVKSRFYSILGRLRGALEPHAENVRSYAG